MLYQKVRNKIQCVLCPHQCILHEGKTGICGVRQNIGGKIRSKNYGLISGFALDPIEKKPLYHFYPGSKILSIGSLGCNLKCNFCQNWQISQISDTNTSRYKTMSVDEMLAETTSIAGNIGLAFTYNEPTVWYEFMFDVAKACKQNKLKTVMVSNGFISKKPLEALLPFIDAFNIDIKAFTENFYHEMTGGALKPVLDSLKTINKNEKHLELTNLIIPRKNDDPEQFSEMVNWISNELGPHTVLHISRYFPAYKQSIPATSEQLLLELYEIARTKLHFVYLGNFINDTFQNTYCNVCKQLLITRSAYKTDVLSLTPEGKCTKCETQILSI
ncbi:MAG: AmmeMemoRadiSam system radical SAM enzyme [Bacteroidetes bacterium HGW-Bacteroidetes-4]|jgi:pyruvate formate lyase activating enzyme|nr:MAG: AmmeMemoRadiSam system radical SAM enzyme [Bacteroidetes bacterium HGW-Bacteroidetes-4]